MTEGIPGVQRIVVSITDEYLNSLEVVLDTLRAAGMRVDEVFEPLGTITGSAAPNVLARLRSLPGVVAVEPERDHQLPPPDSDLQ